MADARITVVSRDGCHLCDLAKQVVTQVDADLQVGWTELDVDEDLDLYQRFSDKVPVILVDGIPVAYWGIAESRLREALTAQ